MADKPWKGKLLTPGQVAQRLISLGCTRVGKRGKKVEYWKPPSGPVFSIRLDDCDDLQIEGIAEQIERWVKESQKKD